jgi:TRAP-type uncharacterized transport system fused permease subunit
MQEKFESAADRVVTVLAFALGSFHLLNVSGVIALSTRDIRITHLLVMLAMLFLSRPAFAALEGRFADQILRLLLAAGAVATSLCILARWQDIAMSGGETEALDAWVDVGILLLVLEAARRGVGLMLACICAAFFTYPFYSSYLPGVLHGRGYSLERMAEFLTTTSQGVYGVPLGVWATYIVLFAIYGAFLSEFGAGDFFFRLARRLTRGMRAAGAIEAVVSTGGGSLCRR